MIRDEPKIADAFRTGEGVGWHEHDHGLFQGTETFFRPDYVGNLRRDVDPGARRRRGEARSGRDGRRRRLRPRRLDDPDGEGVSAVAFVGFDYHPPSIDTCAQAAREAAGVDDGVTFEVAAAKDYPGTTTTTSSPTSTASTTWAIRSARRRTSCSRSQPDGTWMIVGAVRERRVEDNLNPVGRLFYSASTIICTPASLSQEVGLALGAQAGEARLREV